RSPDPSSSRAPVRSALVQISVTRHHQHSRPALRLDAREVHATWQVPEGKKMAGRLLWEFLAVQIVRGKEHRSHANRASRKYLILARGCAFILRTKNGVGGRVRLGAANR